MADFVNNIEVLQYKAPKHLPDANSKHINSAEQTNACLTQQIRNAMELSGVVRPTSLVRSDEVDPLFLSKSIQQQAMFAQSYEIDASSTANNIIIIPAVQDKQLSTVKLDDNGTEITPTETNVVGTVDGQVFDEIQNGSIFQFIPTLNNTSSTVNLTVRIKHLKWDSGTNTQIVETKDFTYPVKAIDGISDIGISDILVSEQTIVQFDATQEVFKIVSQVQNVKKYNLAPSATIDTTNASNILYGTLNKDRLPSVVNSFTVAKQNTTIEGGQINFESPDGLGSGYIDVYKDTINNRYKHRFFSNFNGSNQEAFGIEYNSSGLLRQIYTALGKNLSTNGYITLTDGLILQWGTGGTIASGGSVTITLPITFPNQFLHVYATVVGGGGNTVTPYYVLSEVTSLSTTTLRNTSPNALVARWFAIGF